MMRRGSAFDKVAKLLGGGGLGYPGGAMDGCAGEGGGSSKAVQFKFGEIQRREWVTRGRGESSQPEHQRKVPRARSGMRMG